MRTQRYPNEPQLTSILKSEKKAKKVIATIFTLEIPFNLSWMITTPFLTMWPCPEGWSPKPGSAVIECCDIIQYTATIYVGHAAKCS